MQVTAYQLGTRHQSALARVEAIADPAARLVEKKLGERVGRVRIIVSDERGSRETVTQADQQVIGTTRRPLSVDSGIGYTTLDPAGGTLVVIDAESCGTDQRIDETVVHELVHAVQFGRPGIREARLSAIRNNHGIHLLTWRQAFALNRQVAAHEREAARLESLARKLR
ncbi:hypothetical protein [Streptomyces gardneri]|uniref:hypothetical protein n=1 Tax=Streptomyces gardneri TaxID=66892 RepID=UPI0035DEC251